MTDEPIEQHEMKWSLTTTPSDRCYGERWWDFTVPMNMDGEYRILTVTPEPPKFEFDRIEEHRYNTITKKHTLILTRWRSTKGLKESPS